VLVLTQDRCTVCTERTIGSQIVLDALNVLVRLETVLVLVQDRCTVCTEHTIGIEIVLDALDGTPR
jgi:hypothetical protein